MMKASIFAFTSRYEGFAMVLLEAMQCGLPVVSYDTKCGPRDIIVEKVNGFLVEEGDENTFCDKLKILMNDKALRLKMGISAKNIVAQEFSEYSIMNKWKALFEQS
jgi:glycosyltransferase involved in cell wall biosynthesis